MGNMNVKRKLKSLKFQLSQAEKMTCHSQNTRFETLKSLVFEKTKCVCPTLFPVKPQTIGGMLFSISCIAE